jgi:ubiquinone/menaquinone biosynthesis C-methylase UbiE
MKSEVYNPPFSQIAPYYDQLMSFVNYFQWVEYIEKILVLNGIKENKILDLACGTGICLKMWRERGYEVIGLDASPEMLEVCRGRLNGGASLICTDMRQFSLRNPVSIVTCLYDSLNYLLNQEDLRKCLNSVYNSLCEGGIFIFDMNTIHSLRDEWGNQTFMRQDGNIKSFWNNTYDTEKNISSLKLALIVHENKTNTILKEFHQERGYPIETIDNLLCQAGFQSSFYQHLTFQPARETDVRIAGVARKP